MQEIFLLEDLLNVLIELEKLGNIHYRKMSHLADDARLKSLFLGLSEQELTHRKIYEAYKKEKIMFEEQALPTEYQDYMEALLKSTMTFLNQNKDFVDFNAGYQIAISLEKETLLFLNEMKEVVDKSHYETIDRLMNEERKHLRFLLNFK